MERKKQKRTIAILAVIVAIILLIIVLLMRCGGEELPPPTQAVTSAATTQTTAPPTTVPPTTVPPTTVPPTTVPPTTVPPATVAPTKPNEAPPTTVPPTTAPVETQPQLTDPAAILAQARSLLKSVLSGGKETGSVTDAKQLTAWVSATEDVRAAAQAVVTQLTERLAGVTGISEYSLSFGETQDGRHSFVLAYRTDVPKPDVSLNYETNRLVTDVCAYLAGLGKEKYDSRGSDSTGSQTVIIPAEYTYETALEIAKGQTESATARYRSFDFYFDSLTVTTKGGVEKPALRFYIIYK